MLTNKEIILLEKDIKARAKKGKIVFIKKDLSIEEALKKSLCKIIVGYLVQHKITSDELSKKLKMQKKQMERTSLYQYDKINFDFLITVVQKLSKIDDNSLKRMNSLIKSLN